MTPAKVISAPKPQRSIGIMVVSSLVSACCGIVVTFCVPRLLTVEDFGAWRTFLLYGGYAGLLHLGLIDGALLVWSREKSKSGLSDHYFRSLLYRAVLFVIFEHLLLISLAAITFLFPVHPSLPMLLVAVAVYGLLYNLVALIQVFLQTGFRFTAVAFGMIAPGVFFVISIGILALTHASVSRLLVGYLIGWVITVISLVWMARQSNTNEPPIDNPLAIPLATVEASIWRIGITCIAAGWPIVLANSGFGLMQSADRVTVNLYRPLHDFAIYSFSQSTIYVPIAILGAVSRVAFSWFARAHEVDRAALYRSSTRLLTLIWMLLVPSYFAVERLVRGFLPRYVAGLPAGRILLISVLFLSLIQIVQLNTYSLRGRQRQFFLGSIGAVAVAFATAWFGSQKVGTLTAVAWSQVITAGLWWLGNEWWQRDEKLLGWRDMIAVLSAFSVSTAGMYVALLGVIPWVLRPVIYCAFVGVPAFLLYGTELRNGWNGIANLQPGSWRKS